jgi:hypothetical protein
LRFQVVLPGFDVRDQLGVGFENRLDDAELIGAQRRAGFGDFDDGIGQIGRLDFGGAPTEFDARFDAFAFRDNVGWCDQFGGDDLAFEILART